VKRVVNDPAVDVRFTGSRSTGRADAKLDPRSTRNEAAGTRIYNAPTLPTMSTGDHCWRNFVKGVQCFGITARPSTSRMDQRASAHSDRERLLEPAQFVRFSWDVISNLARAR
jgi:hypothetical protein